MMFKFIVVIPILALIMSGLHIPRATAAELIAQADIEQRLNLARKLFERSGNKIALTTMMDQMRPAMTAMMVQVNPGKAAEMKELVDNVIYPEMQARFPEAIEAVVQIYVQHFTAEELSDLTSFYETSLGQKLISTQPIIMQQSMIAGQAWGKRVAQEAFVKHQDKFLEKGIKN